MLISSKDVDLGLKVKLAEPKINREASNYIMENYKDVVKIIRSAGGVDTDKIEDLIQDVYISIIESEEDGNGFDMNYGTHGLMNVEQFVLGRIKLYAKNAKYKKGVVESYKGKTRETRKVIEEVIDEKGRPVLDSKGNVRTRTRKVVERADKLVTATAASFNEGGDVEDNNDEFQKAYAMAATADSTDDTAEMLSMREQIEFCIDICDKYEVNILHVFRNIDLLANLVKPSTKKRKPEGVFAKIAEIAEYNPDFYSAFNSILRCSAHSNSAKGLFESIIAQYC